MSALILLLLLFVWMHLNQWLCKMIVFMKKLVAYQDATLLFFWVFYAWLHCQWKLLMVADRSANTVEITVIIWCPIIMPFVMFPPVCLCIWLVVCVSVSMCTCLSASDSNQMLQIFSSVAYFLHKYLIKVGISQVWFSCEKLHIIVISHFLNCVTEIVEDVNTFQNFLVLCIRLFYL